MFNTSPNASSKEQFKKSQIFLAVNKWILLLLPLHNKEILYSWTSDALASSF